MDLSLFFAGTAGSVPSARRGLPALLIRRGGQRILIDCGEGTQRQLVRSVGLADLTDIFLTHLHADHWLGLPGMLKSFELRDRERPLTVHGPPGTTALLERMRPIYGRPRYGLTLRDLEPEEVVRRDDLEIVPFAVRHRGVAFGYALLEDDRPGRFDAALAERLGVTPGPDFGRLQRGEAVGGVSPEQVVGEARLGRKVVVTGDTAPTDAVVVAAHRADLLVHEATFTHEDADRAAATLHSTARQAAQVAADAEVRLLALTHLSSRYAGGEIRDEARAVFAATEVPRDFDTIEVPLPERGAPELVRWDRGASPRRPSLTTGG
ncbi:MAG TPA: ribonuclease Z [Solirubrobacteraceae bacterium]|jgi:ribonuclease Z|nr:ribonuclease Z [Solirubrobacteraceae bacterium]